MTDAPELPAKPAFPPSHGELAPGRHITPEMVALLERQGVTLPPPAEVETESAFL